MREILVFELLGMKQWVVQPVLCSVISEDDTLKKLLGDRKSEIDILDDCLEQKEIFYDFLKYNCIRKGKLFITGEGTINLTNKSLLITTTSMYKKLIKSRCYMFTYDEIMDIPKKNIYESMRIYKLQRKKESYFGSVDRTSNISEEDLIMVSNAVEKVTDLNVQKEILNKNKDEHKKGNIQRIELDDYDVLSSKSLKK